MNVYRILTALHLNYGFTWGCPYWWCRLKQRLRRRFPGP
jgi:hypothetical protein